MKTGKNPALCIRGADKNQQSEKKSRSKSTKSVPLG